MTSIPIEELVRMLDPSWRELMSREREKKEREEHMKKMAMPPSKASVGYSDEDFIRLAKEYDLLRDGVLYSARTGEKLEDVIF